MWAYVKDGAIKQTNTVQTRLEINSGSYFPVKYANEWTKEQKEAYGVYEVVVDETNKKGDDYYTNTDSTFTFADGKVTQTWGSATAKKLTDTKWTQTEIDEGKAPAGADTNTVSIVGLTNQHKNKVFQHTVHIVLSSFSMISFKWPSLGQATNGQLPASHRDKRRVEILTTRSAT